MSHIMQNGRATVPQSETRLRAVWPGFDSRQGQ